MKLGLCIQYEVEMKKKKTEKFTTILFELKQIYYIF